MRLTPPVLPKMLLDLKPGELVWVRLHESRPTLAFAAAAGADGARKRMLVCLDAAPRNGPVPTFLPTAGLNGTALSLGTDYRVSPDLSQALAVRDAPREMNGALLFSGDRMFMRVRGVIGGFEEECLYDLATGVINPPSSTDDASWTVPAWSLRLDNPLLPDIQAAPLFSFSAEV